MTSESQNFETLLAEVGIAFTPPPGFMPCSVRDNGVFRYQYALRSISGDLELRFQIDSFTRMEAERKAAGIEMLADVNQVYEDNYLNIINKLSNGVFPDPMLFERRESIELFNADLAALCFLGVKARDFSPDYDAACVFGFHKEYVADAYLIGLYNKGSGADHFFDEPPDFRFF